MVNKDMAHPSMVRDGEGKILPVYWLRATKDTIYNTESGFQVRVTLLGFGFYSEMPSGDGLEELVGFTTDALALYGEVEERLGTKVGPIFEFRD